MFTTALLRGVARLLIVTVTAMSLQPLTVAAQAARAQPAQPAAPGPGERYAKQLGDIEATLMGAAPQVFFKGKPPADFLTVKAQVKTLREQSRQLQQDEAAAEAEFDAIAQHLRDANLPAEILNRHSAMLADYQVRKTEFKRLMQAVEAADDAQGDLYGPLDGLARFMAKYPNRKAHTPTDPNNLPWGSPKPVTREPYTTPAQFQLSRLFGGPLKLAAAGSLSGLGLPSTTLPATPTAADLAETEDVQLTQAIRAQADALNRNPVQIYNWVRNNIEFIPSYGSIQGADMTLQTRRGNAFDSASLLIALLRASGIAARYVYGTVEVPADKVMNWVGGVTVPQAAQSLMGQGGIPNIGLASGGQVKSIRFEHVWVEAYVDYVPSRGAKHIQGDTWVPMDGSFKQYAYTQGMDIKTNVPFDAQSFITQIQQSATMNTTEGWISNVDQSLIQQSIASYQTRLANYVSSQKADATIGDALGTQTIIQENRSILLGSLPYTRITTGAKFQTVPDNLRWKFSYNVYASDTDRANDNPFISYTQSTPNLAGKKITLSFNPASQADQDTLNSFLPQPHSDGSPILPSELPQSLPGYLIRLIPELRVDGHVVESGPAYTMGMELIQNAGLLGPMTQPERGNDNVVVVGEHRVTAINGQGFDMAMVNLALAQLQAARLSLQADTTSREISQAAAEAALFSGLVAYFAYGDAMNRLTSLAAKVLNYRSPSFGNFLAAVEPQFYFGVPRNVRFTGLNIDVDRLATINVSHSNDTSQRVAYNIQQGMQLSSFEHLVLERLFTDGAQGGRAQSTIQALATASASGQRIIVLDQQNLDAALPLLHVQPAVKQELTAAVSAGRLAVVHADPVTIGAWVGFGYAILDMGTGAAAYQISGGTNGGFLSFLGAAFAQPTLFLPPCGDTFLQTLWRNFVITNDIIPGLALPMFSTLFTAGTTASAIGGVTILEAIGLIMTVPMSPLVWPAIIAGALLTALINWLIFQIVFEIGILIGSAVGAAACRRQ